MENSRRDEFSGIALGALSALYNAAVRLTGNDRDAEDLVQETYLHAFEHADQLKSLAGCRVWLFRIMRNRFISLRRAARARPELVLVERALEKLPAADEAAIQLERAAIARISRSAIEKALAGLPADMRTALTMCDIEGFSYHEISEILECPIGTVRSRIARAREHLQTPSGRFSLFVLDKGAVAETGRQRTKCTSTGGYEVCLVWRAPEVLAMVADQQQAALVMPDLKKLAASEQP